MLKRIKAWLKRHKKAVAVTATIVAVTGTVATLIIYGKKVNMSVDELSKKLLPDNSKEINPVKSVSAPTMQTMVNQGAATDLVSVTIDGEIKTFNRSEFVRRLHEGWSASEAKLAEAAEKGIQLHPGETLVNECTVRMKVS